LRRGTQAKYLPTNPLLDAMEGCSAKDRLDNPPGSGLMGRDSIAVRPSGDAEMNRQAILDRLSAEAPALRLRYGLGDLAVFGSVARDQAHEGSDLDILVTFEGKADFDRFMGLKLDLEDLFGRAVDLVTANAVRPELRQRIEREAIHVP
jgi:predicted nucleotidyltransferase